MGHSIQSLLLDGMHPNSRVHEMVATLLMDSILATMTSRDR